MTRLDTVLMQRFGTDRRWASEQEVSTCAGFWKGDDVANGLRVAEHCHHAIEAYMKISDFPFLEVESAHAIT